MLERLEIKDLALIESASLEFSEGFTVFTGETGAGKSLLMGAIKAITGDRMGKEWIRTGAEKTEIQALFSNLQVDFPDFFSMNDESDAQELIIKRELSTKGRGICKINSDLYRLQDLRTLGVLLADIHGQNEQQRIFDTSAHLPLLDNFASKALSPVWKLFKPLYKEWKSLQQEKKRLIADPKLREKTKQAIEKHLEYFEQVAPKPKEDEDLRVLRRNYLRRQNLVETLVKALAYLESEDTESLSILQALKDMTRTLASVQDESRYVRDLIDSLDTKEEELRLIVNKLQKMIDSVDFDESALEQVEDRITVLDKLKTKYGKSLDDCFLYFEKLNEKAALLSEGEDRAKKVLERIDALELELKELAKTLHEIRLSEAERLSGQITEVLAELNIPSAKFVVDLQLLPFEMISEQGLDRCSFLFSANAGEDLKPLASTASGGEASRIMLAIKVILAEADPVPLLIFDEIDAGISGSAAMKVGENLASLGQTHQVLCVTHQPSVAALAKTHYFISKVYSEGRTRTKIEKLDREGRVEELARLLGASTSPDEARSLARSMLNSSQ